MTKINESFRLPNGKTLNVHEYKELKVGDTVNFHLLINGPVTSSGHTVKAIERTPNNYGVDVAWITDKSGCVALTALSKEPREYLAIGTTSLGKSHLQF